LMESSDRMRLLSDRALCAATVEFRAAWPNASGEDDHGRGGGSAKDSLAEAAKKYGYDSPEAVAIAMKQDSEASGMRYHNSFLSAQSATANATSASTTANQNPNSASLHKAAHTAHVQAKNAHNDAALMANRANLPKNAAKHTERAKVHQTVARFHAKVAKEATA
jgi:hypothetical protein